MKEKLIEAGWVKLSEDAFDQTTLNFNKAIKSIDEKFGEGYAKSHPELVGAFLQASSNEYNGVVIGACIQELKDEFESIADALNNVANQIDFDKIS